MGRESEIISFKLQYPHFLFPGKTQFDVSGKAPDNIPIITEINSVNPINWIRVGYKIKNMKPDYVIVRFWLPFMGPCLGTICWILRKAGIKIIAITDNVIPHEKRLGDKLFTSYFISKCDGFITMSRSVLDELSLFTKTDKKRFVPHPIYDIFGEKVSKKKSFEQLGLIADCDYLLFFGLIRKYKGLDLLLKAFGEIHKKLPNLRLLVAGEMYEDEAYYQKLIDTFKIRDKVIMESNYIPAEMVRFYFGASDLITQPYRTATQSGVTQIAYHFEKPMLVTNVGGLAEIVSHKKSGYVCEPIPSEIATCILDFYEHNRYKEFENNVKKEKHRFSWENMVNGIEELVKLP